MKKIITLVTLLLVVIITNAQVVTITTEGEEYCKWDSTSSSWTDSCEYLSEYRSRIEFNQTHSIFKHTTLDMSSTYYVDTFIRDSTETTDFFIYDVTSDVGNKYRMVVNLKKMEIRWLSWDGVYSICTNIKHIF